MKKLMAVEEARALMSEAQAWGVWRWLTEKRRVREAADKATEALAEANRTVKASWPDDLKKAYHELDAEAALDGKAATKRKYEKAMEEARDVDAETKAAARRVKDADDEAYRATMDAEDTFAEAERRMSTGMAKEGAQKALESYDLRETAIRKAEVAGRPRALHA